jgi:hypothetical protein
MNNYSSPYSDLILTKTNSIVGVKLTEFPQYSSAIPLQLRMKIDKQEEKQLPNILSIDNDVNPFETVNTMFMKNAFYKSN